MLLGVIPARGGSKTIPRKNLHPLNGKPLIDYTIEAAKASKLDDFVVSTEDEEIKEHCSQFCKVIVRPDELAQDATPMLPVVQQAVQEYEAKTGNTVDAVMLLQPTSPLRTAGDIDEAIEMFINSNIDSLVSVYEGIHPVKSYDQDGRPFLPQVPYDKHKHQCLTRNGAIFITRRDLLDSGRLIGDSPLFYVMPKSRSIDIDDMDDLLVTEAILSKGEIQ